MASPHVDVDDLVATLEQIRQRGHSAHTVFRDWVELMLFALQRRDEPYLEILEGYRDRADLDQPEGQRSADLFATAFGQLQERMAETDADVLGAVYEEYGMSSDAFGQHFTPHSVCEMMAEISGIVDDNETGGRQTVLDPACGSGRMLLVGGRRHPEALFVGQDKDPLCAKMAALNCCFFNLDAYIVQGDSLTVEYQRAWQTSHSPMGGSVRELDKDEVEDLRESLTSAFENTAEEVAPDDAGQDSERQEESRSVSVSTLSGGEQASLLAFDSDH
ncbi:N-6 DNA methylase [Haloarcula pelagica]|uniref:N-6 DNA methylase n=1 Tax=Haloarcula pelagica TaxID=3033389 RepID=UPI0024C413B3|nr:N-6 DNA methylase [Halomicroarcula sp. YJ-61-S]